MPKRYTLQYRHHYKHDWITVDDYDNLPSALHRLANATTTLTYKTSIRILWGEVTVFTAQIH